MGQDFITENAYVRENSEGGRKDWEAERGDADMKEWGSGDWTEALEQPHCLRKVRQSHEARREFWSSSQTSPVSPRTRSVVFLMHSVSDREQPTAGVAMGGPEVWWFSTCSSWNFLQLEVCKPHFLGQPKWHIPCIDTALNTWMHAKSQRKHLNIIYYYCYYTSATATVILVTPNWCVPSLSHI